MLIITGLYSALFAFWIQYLAFRVIKRRQKYQVGLLDNNNPELRVAIRIHGNAIETIPIAMIVFACAESQNLPSIYLHLAGILLIFSRVIHMKGLSQSTGISWGRFYGTIGTWLIISLLGIYNLSHFFVTILRQPS